MIKDNRIATQELFDKVTGFLEEACHCTEFKFSARKIWVTETDENESLGSIPYEKHYDTCKISFGSKTLSHTDSDPENIKKVALVMNELRLKAGVQCEDWEEVKIALGIA